MHRHCSPLSGKHLRESSNPSDLLQASRTPRPRRTSSSLTPWSAGLTLSILPRCTRCLRSRTPRAGPIGTLPPGSRQEGRTALPLLELQRPDSLVCLTTSLLFHPTNQNIRRDKVILASKVSGFRQARVGWGWGTTQGNRRPGTEREGFRGRGKPGPVRSPHSVLLAAVTGSPGSGTVRSARG